MKKANKKKIVNETLYNLRDFIWVEDLYLLLRQKGQNISISTVRDSIEELDRSGRITQEFKNRKTFVKYNF